MLFLLLFVLSLAYAHGIQVNTTEGIVEGSRALDGNYYVFYGIPYAGPTSGINRFKDPVPPSPYNGVFHAINNNILCAQPTTRGLIGVEDCLALNVFTKNVTASMPVIVWLNADEYTYSDTQLYSVRSLIESNVTFVTVNFRLSIFGFLCLGVDDAPGNAGLKDIIQALKWIKSNIASFGGDPNNVLLMGHASGAAMVDILTLSPKVENLMHKAIVLSGSALAPWAYARDPTAYAQLVGAKLGYAGKSPAELAKRFQQTDIYVLNTALNEFKFFNNTPLFAPCSENVRNGVEPVITNNPHNNLELATFNHIPIIYGYTNREGTMRAEEADTGNWLNSMQANFTSFLPADLLFHKNETAEVASIRQFYFGNGTIDMGLIEDFLEYQGDTLVLTSVIKSARSRALKSKKEVKLMEFAYLGTKNSRWIYNRIPLSGAAHGAFLNYLFEDDLRPQDLLVSKSLVARVTSFAHSGATEYKYNSTEQVTWQAITPNLFHYLYYGGDGSPTLTNMSIYSEEGRVNPHSQKTTFWDRLYNEYWVAPKPPSTSSSNIMVSSCILVMLFQIIVRLF